MFPQLKQAIKTSLCDDKEVQKCQSQGQKQKIIGVNAL